MHPRNELHHHDPTFVDRVMPFFRWLRRYFRYEAVGLNNIPSHGASMVVMNHGIIPYHGFLLALECVEKLRLYPRGLGAGFLFDIPYIREFFLYGGAVNANPRNAKELLQAGHCIMLAPGGIYESLITAPDLPRIPWEQRFGFAEVACETESPIIPSYCNGIDKVYHNSKFLLRWRIKFLEKTRLPLPLFAGLGLIPFPAKLIQYVGRPIATKARKKESLEARTERVHQQVMKAMWQLKTKAIDF